MLNGQLYSSFVKCSCVLFIEYQNELIFKRKYTGSSPVGWGLASVSSWLHCCYHHHRNCRDCQAFLPLVTRCSFLQFTELLSALPRGLSDSALRYCSLDFCSPSSHSGCPGSESGLVAWLPFCRPSSGWSSPASPPGLSCLSPGHLEVSAPERLGFNGIDSTPIRSSC